MKDHGFRKTSSVEINETKVNSAVKPMGGKDGISLPAMVYSAGTGSLDGPFRWRVEAVGEEGVHEWIHVNRATVTTEKTKWVLFELEPESQWNTKTVFLPVELVKSFGGNPREWDW